MKKFVKAFLALLMMLCLALGVAACNDKPSDPPPADSGVTDDQGSDKTDDNKDDDNKDDDGKDDDGGKDDDTPSEPVDLGVFAAKWVSADGVLDLSVPAYSEAESFTVKSMTGEGETAVISVEADGAAYTLQLDGGKLKMSDADGEEVDTFQISPDALAGSWAEDDEWSYVYYSIDPVITSDGTFAWGYYAPDYDGIYEMGAGDGETAFSIDEDGKAVITYEGYDEYGGYTFTYTDTSFQVDDGYYGAYDLIPYEFDALGDYFSDAGRLSVAEDSIKFGGATATYELKQTASGAGYVFTAGEEEYMLQLFGADCYLVGSERTMLVYYDSTFIVADWYTGDGSAMFSAEDDTEITVAQGTKSETVPLTVAFEDGEIVFTFDCSLGAVKFSLYEDTDVAMAYTCVKDGTTTEGTVIWSEEREYYLGIEVTDNWDTVSVSDNQQVTVDLYDDGKGPYEPVTAQGKFVYVDDGYGGTVGLEYYDADAEETYILTILADGMYATMVYDEDYKAYGIYSVYYSTDIVDDMAALFEGSYTTGGSEPSTITFDLSGDTKLLLLDGVEVHFFWDIDYGIDDDTYEEYAMPAMSFADADFENGKITELYYYSLSLDGNGLLLEMEIDSTGDAYQLSYVPTDVYEKALGSSYTYHGEYFDETFTLDENGVFKIATTDNTDSNSAVTLQEYDYYLEYYIDEDDREAFRIGFNTSGESYVYAYIYDWAYGKVMDIVYSPDALKDYVGSYYAEDSELVLERNGDITLDGETVTPTFDGATATFGIDETNYTAVFAEGGVTLTANDTPVAYTKAKFTPLEFVGTYTLGDETIAVSTSAISANITPSFDITIDGSPILTTPKLTFVDGKQTLSFSVMGFPDPTPVNYTLTLDNGQITLSNGTDTATAESNAWGYGDFIPDGEVTLDDDTVIVCLSKEGGKVPLYRIKGDATECQTYLLSRGADDTVTLTVSIGTKTLELVLVGSELTVQWKASTVPPAPPLS